MSDGEGGHPRYPDRVRLYGAGGHSRVVASIFEANGMEVVATFEDRPATRHRATVNVQPGVRLTGGHFPSDGPPVLITIGNNGERAEISEMIHAEFATAIHPSTVIAPTVTIGEGSVVHHGSIIQANTRIGRHVLVNTAASIDHDILIGDFAHISPNVTLCGHVEIGEGTHVGASATVIPKVKIGRWCTIGAGAVVIEDVPDYSTVVGVPGTVIKTEPPSGLANPPPVRHDYDVVFVGAGISSTFTLLDLLGRLQAEPPHEVVRIAIIDKSDDVFAGLPYGDRSGGLALLITPLDEFIPASERNSFYEWLSRNRHWLVEQWRSAGGDEALLETLARPLTFEQWDELFVPRRFFGLYLQERANRALDAAHRDGIVDYDIVRDEVISVDRDDSRYTVGLATSSTIVGERVVLGLGSTPVRSAMAGRTLPSTCYAVDNLYEQSLDHHLDELRTLSASSPVRALVIGANASALEALYVMGSDPTIGRRLERVVVLSPRGRLPDSLQRPADAARYEPDRLTALQAVESPTADQLARAALCDLHDAEAAGIPVSVTLSPISSAVVATLTRMDRTEKLSFARRHGSDIGRHQRRAGHQYLGVVENLARSDRLTLVAGTIDGIDVLDSTLRVHYRSPSGERRDLGEEITVVVNCGPSTVFGESGLPPLLEQLTNSTLADANETGRGLNVNERLEVAPALHVIGPMLAGNVVNDVPIWHVEHCGRIASFANYLGELLAADLSLSSERSTAR